MQWMPVKVKEGRRRSSSLFGGGSKAFMHWMPVKVKDGEEEDEEDKEGVHSFTGEVV